MPTLYVTEPGATVRLRGDSLQVTRPPPEDGAPPPAPDPTVELHRLELVALCGHVHITADALHACIDRGITVAFFWRNGRFRARLAPEQPRAADLRTLQYAAWHDAAVRLERARRVVAAKARNAAAVLRDIQSNHAGNSALASALAQLKALAGPVSACDDAEALLGWEGTAARTYFEALAHAFSGPIGFAGRQQRPPPDPANALLSFGYVLLANLLAGRLEARGLDPALGFYHAPRPGRPSLALDLLEELRHPVVDRFVLRACNLRIVRPEHFEADPDRPGGVRATRDGLKQVLREWEAHLLKSLRDAEAPAAKIAVGPLLDRQVERLVADLRGGAPYQPFEYGG